MSKLQVTNVRTKLNSFTICISFAGKLLLDIYVFTLQLKNPNSLLLFTKLAKILQILKQETPIIKNKNIF